MSSPASPPASWTLFFFNDTATTEIYTLSLHDALPISGQRRAGTARAGFAPCRPAAMAGRSEAHTSELQSPDHLVCRLLLANKKTVLPLLLFYLPRLGLSTGCAIALACAAQTSPPVHVA